MAVRAFLLSKPFSQSRELIRSPVQDYSSVWDGSPFPQTRAFTYKSAADDCVLKEIRLVRVNSAMVERLWSMYNARHKDHGHAFGPGERQRVVKKRWAAVHRRGGR